LLYPEFDMRIRVVPTWALRCPHERYTISLDRPGASKTVIRASGDADDRLDGKAETNYQGHEQANRKREYARFGTPCQKESRVANIQIQNAMVNSRYRVAPILGQRRGIIEKVVNRSARAKYLKARKRLSPRDLKYQPS
jgi:hypothetical protein